MGDDRASEGLDHLQTAARELIGAARAFLDVAEEVIADHDAVAEIVDVFGSIADAASRAARGAPLRPGGARPGGRRGAGDGDDPDPPSGVEHISVS